MTPSDKLREIAEKWGWFVKTISLDNHRFELNKNPEQLLSDLTALISEHYTANEEVDKMVEERLREELMAYDKFLSNTYWGVSHIVKRDEAVRLYLKSREK